MTKNLICLGGGIESIQIIKRVKELGFRAVVVDGDPNAPAFAIADRAVAASCYHANEAIRELKLLSDEKFDGVMCCAIDAPLAAAEIREAFNLPGLKPSTLDRSVTKFEQKQRLACYGIPVPNCLIARDDTVWKRINGKIYIVKPNDSRGARGVVRLLDDMSIYKAYHQAKEISPSGTVIIEEWLDGMQLSTESIIQDSKVLYTFIGERNYSRLAEFAPHVIEDGFDAPTEMSGELRAKINATIEKSCVALRWDNLTVKGDMVIHNGVPYIIELAPRLSGGFFASQGAPMVDGVDLVGAAIKLALGYSLREDEIRPYHRGRVSQRYIFPSKDDIGKTVKEIKTIYPSEFYSINIKAGYVIQSVTSHKARLGQVMTDTPERAVECVEALKRAMVIE